MNEDKDFQDIALKYGSVVVDCVHRNNNFASLDEKLSAESERRSDRSINRKDSKENVTELIIPKDSSNPMLARH